MTDVPDAAADRAASADEVNDADEVSDTDTSDDVVEERDDGVDVVDSNVDRFLDRMVQGTGGTIAGNAMVGLGKAMGLHKETEIAAEVREGDEPERDPDDPIEVTIDPRNPENTRIVFHMRAADE